MARHVAVFLAFVLMAASALAQDATGSAEPDVVLSVPDSSKVVAWRALRLQYTIINGTRQSGIGVRSLTISLPSTVALTSSTLGRAQDGSIKVAGSPFQMRSPGQRRECAPIELRAKYLSEMRTQLFSLLTYRGQKETIVATLEYEPLDSPGTSLTKTAKLELNVTPNPIGIFFGALLGALLIALLIPMSNLATQLSKGENIEFHRKVEFERFLARFGRGTIASAIAVLVLQTTSDFSFPISVGVQDFYGGVLIGLLAEKVARQIITKTEDAEPEPSPPSADADHAAGV